MMTLFLLLLPWLNAVQSPPTEVNVFLACECPISQKYIPLLNSLYKEHPEVEWRFIVPGKVSKQELSGFTREFGVEFPLVVDRRGSKVKKLHAVTTPQAIIVKGGIVYSGAIDNWFYGLGQYRREPTEHYLIDALTALSQGRDPAVKTTEAIGCPIANAH